MTTGSDFTYLRSIQPNAIAPVDYNTELAILVRAIKEKHPEWTESPDHFVYTLAQAYVSRYTSSITVANVIVRSSFPAWAQGKSLDDIGANYNVGRIQGEDDEHYLLRILRAPIALRGAAGSKPRIEYNAYSASDSVIDVQVVARGNGQDTDVYVLSSEEPAGNDPQGTPSLQLLSEVRRVVNARDQNILEFENTIQGPTFQAYTTDATLGILPTRTDANEIAARARARYYRYLIQRHRIGLAVRTDGIEAALYGDDGDVETVTLTAPAADLDATNGRVYFCPRDETNVMIATTTV